MKILSAAALGATLIMAGAMSAQASTIVNAIGVCDPASPVPTSFSTFTSQCGASADRTDLGAVNIGAADAAFYSLGINQNAGGFGGIAIFEMDRAFSGLITVEETTFPSNHKEAAAVYVGNSLAELRTKYFASDSAGVVNNGGANASLAVNSLSVTGEWTFLMFEDISQITYGVSGNGTTDGFDLNAFTVSPVPLPAGLLLLGTALGGLGLSRRRKA